MSKKDDEEVDEKDHSEEEEEDEESEDEESSDSDDSDDSDDDADEDDSVAAKDSKHESHDEAHATDDHGAEDLGPEPGLEKDSPRMAIITVAYAVTIVVVIGLVVGTQQFFHHFMDAEFNTKVRAPVSKRLVDLHSAEAQRLKPESVKKAQDTVLAKYKTPGAPKEAPKPKEEPTPVPPPVPTASASASAAPSAAPTASAATSAAPTAKPTAKPTAPPRQPQPTAPDPY